jgi:flagellar biosynthesis component FlhA
VISGKLYLNPETKSNLGNLYRSSDSQVVSGVVKTENIETIAVMRITGKFLGHAILLFALPVVIFCLLMALMFYIGWHSRSSKDKYEAHARHPESGTQPMMPGPIQAK